MDITFLLNGETVTAQAAPTVTLLDWLRTERGLNGTKEGCNEGDCGACTVMVTDASGARSLNACILFMGQLAGKAVRTVEGIAAPEAANNSASITAFVPTLTLGIPGDPIMALMLGALVIHGVQPGPMMLEARPDMFWGLVVSFGIGNLFLLLLNLPLVGIWVAMLRIPFRWLYPAIIVFICLGVYSVRGSTFDIVMVAGIGVVGYALARASFSPALLLLGFVLGPLIETNLRRAMLIARGDPMVFLERPIACGFVLATALLILVPLFKSLRRKRAAV